MPKRLDPASMLLRIILAFLLATLIFVEVFIISYAVSYWNYQGVSNSNNLIKQYLEDFEGYANVTQCNSDVLIEASDKLDRVGSKLNLLESRFGKMDLRVLEQKKLYSELSYRHFEIIRTLKDQCNKNFITILFFYSNSEELAKESEGMGFILSSFKNEDPSRIMIYSFDADLDSMVIRELTERYNVTGAPVSVVNEDENLAVTNINRLKPFLSD